MTKSIRSFLFAISFMASVVLYFFHPVQLFLDDSAKFERSIHMSHYQYEIRKGAKNTEILQSAYSANVLPLTACAVAISVFSLWGIFDNKSRRKQHRISRYLFVSSVFYYVFLVGYFVYLPGKLYVSVLPNWPIVVPFVSILMSLIVNYLIEKSYQNESRIREAKIDADRRERRRQIIQQDEANRRK